MVSGPIGRTSTQLERYDHVILVAGGIGITAIAPIFAAVVRGLPLAPSRGPLASALAALKLSAPAQSYYDAGLRSRGGTLSLLWMVRDEQSSHSMTCLRFAILACSRETATCVHRTLSAYLAATRTGSLRRHAADA